MVFYSRKGWGKSSYKWNEDKNKSRTVVGKMKMQRHLVTVVRAKLGVGQRALKSYWCCQGRNEGKSNSGDKQRYLSRCRSPYPWSFAQHLFVQQYAECLLRNRLCTMGQDKMAAEWTQCLPSSVVSSAPFAWFSIGTFNITAGIAALQQEVAFSRTGWWPVHVCMLRI